MAETYPTQVKTFEVVGRLVKGVVDSNDPLQAPDVVPIVGAAIMFSPSLNPPIFRVPGATTPVTIFQESILATTDEDGFLKVIEDPELGVVLPWGGSPAIAPTGWTWNVSINVGGNFPPRTFAISGGDGVVIDLSSVIPVSPNPGGELAQWISAVNTVNAVKADVDAAKTEVVAAVTTADSILTQIEGMVEGFVVAEDPDRPGFAKVAQDFGDFTIIEDPSHPGFASVTVS